MKRPRCHDCGHPRRRIISATRQTRGDAASLAAATVRKKACDCACHRQTVYERSEAGLDLYDET